MKKSERILGCVYIPVHAAILPVLLGVIIAIAGIRISGAQQLLTYFTVSFALILIIMFKFLRSSFSDLISNFWRAVQAVILGYVLYRVLSWVAVLLLEQVMTSENPNNDAIATEFAANFRIMIVITVILAPIIEETMFRGAVFGTIRQKSRIVAYVVSILLFSVFHIWDYLAFGFSWQILVLIVQYIPPSIALTWSYERGGTIWAPILLHAGINLAAALQF